MSLMYYDLSDNDSSIGASNSLPEVYIPLWYTSSNSVSLAGNVVNATSQGTLFVQKGASSSNTTKTTLHTLSTCWNTNNLYALEAMVRVSNTAQTGNLQLYDFTTATLVAGSLISTTSTGMTVIRTGSFPLRPSHRYGLSIWCSSTVSNYMYISDVSLIVFPC